MPSYCPDCSREICVCDPHTTEESKSAVDSLVMRRLLRHQQLCSELAMHRENARHATQTLDQCHKVLWQAAIELRHGGGTGHVVAKLEAEAKRINPILDALGA